MQPAENPSGVVYQTNASLTQNHDGHASELTTCPVDPLSGEPLVSGFGVTDWFCCIGAGKWDGEVPPSKRACEAGTYTARTVDLSAPLLTDMVWNETNEDKELEASIDLVGPKFP